MPYKDPERRRQYQRDYYHDRNIAKRHRLDIPEYVKKAYKTKSIRFEEEDLDNIQAKMLIAHRREGGPEETLNFSAMARAILIDWAARVAVEERRRRMNEIPADPAF